MITDLPKAARELKAQVEVAFDADAGAAKLAHIMLDVLKEVQTKVWNPEQKAKVN